MHIIFKDAPNSIPRSRVEVNSILYRIVVEKVEVSKSNIRFSEV